MTVHEHASVSVEKIRIIVILVVCFFLVLSCSLVIQEAVSKQVHEETFRSVLMTYLSYYSPIIMLMVGHYVATNKSQINHFLTLHYSILLGVIGMIYVVTPVLCLEFAPSYQSAIIYTQDIGGVFSLPLFLLLGLIFSSDSETEIKRG